jgi:hypothetical protein
LSPLAGVGVGAGVGVPGLVGELLLPPQADIVIATPLRVAMIAASVNSRRSRVFVSFIASSIINRTCV